MKILNRLRFAMFGMAAGLSLDLCAIIGTGAKRAIWLAGMILLLILALAANEIYQDKLRREERQRAELMAAIVRRTFPRTDDEKKTGDLWN